MTKFRDQSLQELEAKCNEQALRFCEVLFPKGCVVGGEFMVRDISGQPGDNLLVNLTSGVWCDFARPEYAGNILNLVYFHQLGGRDWGKTFREARAILRMRDWQPTQPLMTVHSTEDKRKWALATWRSVRTMAGSLGQVYFEGRMLPGAERFSELGYIANCFWRYFEKGQDGPKHEGTTPGVVARLLDVDGQFQAIHRLYLNEQGGKAEFLPEQKKGLGLQHGAACRLQSPDLRVLLSTEAIEDGVAVALAAPDLSVWGTPSASMLGRLQVPRETRILLSGGDNDEAGDHAHARLVARHRDRQDLKILRARPLTHDWNDDVKAHGMKAVADRLALIHRHAMNLVDQGA